MIKVSTSGLRWQRRNYVLEGHFLESTEFFAAAADAPLSRFCLGRLTGYNLSTLAAVKFTANQQ
jgi:hypothetical protein